MKARHQGLSVLVHGAFFSLRWTQEYVFWDTEGAEREGLVPHWEVLPIVDSQSSWESLRSRRRSWSESARVAGRIVRFVAGIVVN